MVMLKSLSTFAVLSALLAAVSVSAGSVTLEIDTGSDDSRPSDATFACVAKSTSCKSPVKYTKLHYDPSLNVTLCHRDGFVKSYWHRIMPVWGGEGLFVNTFYVAVNSTTPAAAAAAPAAAAAAAGGTKPDGYSDCQVQPGTKKQLTARDVREMMADTINLHSSCNAAIQCYDVKEVDDKCFPKQKEDEDEDDK